MAKRERSKPKSQQKTSSRMQARVREMSTPGETMSESQDPRLDRIKEAFNCSTTTRCGLPIRISRDSALFSRPGTAPPLYLGGNLSQHPDCLAITLGRGGAPPGDKVARLQSCAQ